MRGDEAVAYAGPALVVGVVAGDAPLDGPVASVDAALDGTISRLRENGELSSLGDMAVLQTFGRLPSGRVIVVGLGDAAKLTVAGLRRAAAIAARTVGKAHLEGYASTVYGHQALSPRDATQAIVEGSLLGLYRFARYRKSENGAVGEMALLPGALDRTAVEEGVRRGREIAAGVMLARDLINEPSNVLTPTELARRARDMAAAQGLEFMQLDVAAMRELGMEALLGVASGSDEPPAFMVLRYGTAGTGTKPLGLVGKGVTFDSGGISIKPAENMHKMKGDMSGAAAVLGAMRAIAGLKPGRPVTAVIPATENLLGGRAQAPGDIVRAMNGVTIEVINTDAEGRLILADALSWAVREGLAPLVDVATLTGACNVALGPHYSGVFSNDETLAAQVLAAAAATGEKMWRLPLDPAFEEQIKGEYADILNSGGRAGGAITAAMFLQHFVDSTPWAHLDIAPTAWSDKDEGENSKGGTGVAVRTLIALAEEDARG